MRSLKLRGYVLSGVLAAVACGDPAPDPYGGDLSPIDGESDYFGQLAVYGAGPQGEKSASALERDVVAAIDGAESSVSAVFSSLESVAVAEALIRARDRGRYVRVATDIDSVDAGQAGFQTLEDAGFAVIEALPTDALEENVQREQQNAAIRAQGGYIAAGNGSLAWSPQPGVLIDRPGSHNRVTDSYVLVDRLRMISLSGGFPADYEDLDQVAVLARNQTLVIDYGEAFDQMAGGVFAATLTVFGAPLSSDTNNRTFYPTEDGWVGAWFGPQEPNVKHVLDEVYRARSSVFVASSELDNPFLARALRYKAEAGFRVRVLVPANPPPPSRGDQDWYQFLEDAFADLDNAELRRKGHVGGTLVLLDAERSPIDGQKHLGQAMILSSGLVPAIPFRQVTEDDYESFPVDSFSNSNMLSVFEHEGSGGSADFDAALTHFERMWR